MIKKLHHVPHGGPMPFVYHSDWFKEEMFNADSNCQWKDIKHLVEEYNHQVLTILKVTKSVTERYDHV